MQLALLYEWLGQARHQMWVGLATFARTTKTTPSNFEGFVKFEFVGTLELGCETPATVYPVSAKIRINRR